MRILVLGLGNLLLQDEGIGVHVVHRLEREYRFPDGVEILDGGTSGMELMGPIANSGYLIVVDAVKSDAPPRHVGMFEGRRGPQIFQRKAIPASGSSFRHSGSTAPDGGGA